MLAHDGTGTFHWRCPTGAGAMITGTSNLIRRTQGVCAVSFAIAILAGCIAAETLPESFVYRRVSQHSKSEKGGAAFDPQAACGEVVVAHNRIRTEAKLPALAISAKLQAAAERHAKDMAARDQMTHKGGDGTSPIDRIKATGYPYRRAGENVAAGRFAVEGLMKGWMESPHHKRNILGSYSQIGVACATGESGKRYWCVTFGLPIRH
jgi:uncharacterized protein YkwD